MHWQSFPRFLLLAAVAAIYVEAAGNGNIRQSEMIPVWERDPRYAPRRANPDTHSFLLTGNSLRNVDEAAPAIPPQPWVRVKSGASSSRAPPSTRYEIPEFWHAGTTFGPYPIGESRFEPKAYPIKINVFRHLYASGQPRPANFETFVNSDIEANSGKLLDTYGTIYFPEPQRLLEIQNLIWGKLSERGRAPYQVMPETLLPLKEGEWLWPPTEIARNGIGLQIPAQIIERRVRRTIWVQYAYHSQEQPTMLHLTVPTFGRQRHILAYPLVGGEHVRVGFARSQEPINSKLWYFFEGMSERTNGRELNKMAFLGATYLPNDLEILLLNTGVATPAFQSVLHHSH